MSLSEKYLLDQDKDEESDLQEEDVESLDDKLPGRSRKRKISEDEDEADLSDASQSENELSVESEPKSSKKQIKKLTIDKDSIEKVNQARKKSGVIYLSSIPPYMPPSKVKHLLSPFGTLGRIYLVPEDPKHHQQRVRNGGNKKVKYVEGWIEFDNKMDAKMAVKRLNGEQVGGKRGSWWREDIWNMKYLKGFKWDHLTSQMAAERMEREARLKASISQANRENKDYVAQVERFRMIQNMERKGEKRRKFESSNNDNKKARRQEHQRQPKIKNSEEDNNTNLSQVMDSIF